MLQRWALKASVWKSTSYARHCCPHPSFVLSPCAHPALCVPLPPSPTPILCAIAASHPSLCTSSPSSMRRSLLSTLSPRSVPRRSVSKHVCSYPLRTAAASHPLSASSPALRGNKAAAGCSDAGVALVVLCRFKVSVIPPYSTPRHHQMHL